MIRSFRDSRTETIARGTRVKGFPPDLVRRAQNKLTILDYATGLEDLRWPPGNRLERLSADRRGQHYIRINDQWRICFVWKETGPEQVEIVDYH
jgi:toxin HigB-1